MSGSVVDLGYVIVNISLVRFTLFCIFSVYLHMIIYGESFHKSIKYFAPRIVWLYDQLFRTSSKVQKSKNSLQCYLDILPNTVIHEINS
jgi:hypothetical protein